MAIKYIRASDGTGPASVATIQTTRLSGATTIDVDTVQGINETGFMGSMGTPHTFVDPITAEEITVISEDTCVDFSGHVDGANLEIDAIAPGQTDLGSAAEDIVIIKPTTQWADEVADTLEVAHEDDGTLKAGAADRALNAPQGFLINGKIDRTVASNNITVAIKTLAGTNPSTTDPVYVRIGNTIRSITAALSVTKNAGTNWFSKGASYFATNESDYFVYLCWNTTDSAVTIAFSSTPAGRVYSDFSTTNTDWEYWAGSGSAPASTDEVENVGRFNATLSATASFNWSVPATSIVINKPIFETRVFSASNTGTAGGTVYWQQVYKNKRVWAASLAGALTGSGFQSITKTLTFPAGFFAGIRAGIACITSVGSTQFQTVIFNSISTSTGTLYFCQQSGSNGTNAASAYIEGT